MAGTAPYESFLLATLSQSSDPSHIYQLYTEYLKPFTQVSEGNVSLVNQYCGFLLQAAHLLWNRIKNLPRSPDSFDLYLFQLFQLLVTCLQTLSPFVSQKQDFYQAWYFIIYCYVHCGKLDDALSQIFCFLSSMAELLGTKSGTIVPECRDVEPDKVFAKLITDAVFCHLECVELKRDGDYDLIVTLVDGVEPWVRVIDLDNSIHKWLVGYLMRLGCYLLRDPARSNEKFTIDICAISLLKHTELYLDDVMHELEDFIQLPSFFKYDFLWKVLDSMANKSKAKYTNTRDLKAWDMVSTLRSCFEQLQELKDVKCLNPKVSRRLETKISDILVEDKFSKQDESFRTSMDFIAEGKKLREQGIQYLDECIGCLNQAIYAMGDVMSKEEEDRGPTCYVLAQAYALRALCREEKEQKSKSYVEDIRSALSHWSSSDHCKFVEHTCMSRNNFKLLDYVSDLLLMKVDIEDHREIYELMVKFFKQSSNLEERVRMLWQSRSLTHVLCTSPLNAFVEVVSTHRKMSMEEWKDCIPISSGITTLTADTHNLKEAASHMEGVPCSTKSMLIAAQLFYDLGERLVAEGLLSEALIYATKACDLRTNLYKKNFEVSFAEQDGDVGANRKVTSFYVHPLVAAKAWSIDHVEDFISTPYNILRCYLESMLQQGTILEILGDAKGAEFFLLLGKNLSSLRGLTIFEGCFSAAMGRIYRKRQLWGLAAQELHAAMSLCDLISCKKCKLLLEVIVKQESGDLCRSQYNKEAGNFHGNFHIDKAKHRFNSAEDNLRRELDVVCNVKETREVSAHAGKGPQESAANRIATNEHEVADHSDCGCHCLPAGDLNSMESVLHMKWVRTCRRYLLRILVGKGKCFVALDEMESAHKVFLESICLLVSMSKSWSSHSSISFSYFFEFIEKNEIEDAIGTDIASLLYIISWVSLKCSYEQGERNQSSDKLFIPIETLMSGLKVAFILSSEAQGLFRKIAQLMATLYVYFDFSRLMSLSDAPSSCQWACFCHHATLGTNLNFEFYNHLLKVHGVSDSASVLHRLKPNKRMDLENFVIKFLKDLPAATILGITILEDKYMTLLKKLLRPSTIKDSSTQRWLMVSRFNSKREPLVALLPVNPILVGNSEDICPGIFKSTIERGDPPWGKSIIVDKVAPGFRKIVQSHNLCSSQHFDQTEHNKLLVFTWMKELDRRVQSLMGNMEEWFGHSKHILFGEPLEDQNHDKCLSGCHIATDLGVTQTNKRKEKDISPSEDSQKREPVILVTDLSIQMLPWEGMPIMRHQEVYRMPSIASIFYSLNVCRPVEKKVVENSAELDNLLDVYYLVNPSADLDETNSDSNLDGYFKELGFKGKLRESPNVDELIEALVNRDLFIYVGHGNGLQYIPTHKFAKLNRFPTTILMGCASGLLALNGSYPPHGAPLYNILAGSPIVIANLWSTRSLETLIFSKALFKAWIKERSRDPEGNISSLAREDVPHIGSLIRLAREANNFKYIDGGLHVCFGIPPDIRHKS